MISQTTGGAPAAVAGGSRLAYSVPSFWTVTRNTVRRLIKGPLAAPPPNAARDSLLLDASVAIRGGRLEVASGLLAPQGGILASDPAYLNLVGVVCEAQGQWQMARRFYGVAISVAPRFAPAQQNMRRLYELYTFGRSQEPLALGDVDLRRDRTVPGSGYDAE